MVRVWFFHYENGPVLLRSLCRLPTSSQPPPGRPGGNPEKRFLFRGQSAPNLSRMSLGTAHRFWAELDKFLLAGTLGQGSGEAALARKLPVGHTVPSRPRGWTESEELFHLSVDLYQICHAWHLTMDDCPTVFSGIEQVSNFRYQRPPDKGWWWGNAPRRSPSGPP